jgi:hypothetical protein
MTKGVSITVVFEEKTIENVDDAEEEERHLIRGNHFDGFNILSDDEGHEMRLFEG